MSCVTATSIFTKQPSETRSYSMDFSNLLTSTETINTPVATSEERGGGTSDLTISSVVVSGQTVTMTISGGTHAKTYRIEVTISTSGSQTLEGDAMLRIRDR